jgi:hypothetical protein
LVGRENTEGVVTMEEDGSVRVYPEDIEREVKTGVYVGLFWGIVISVPVTVAVLAIIGLHI